MPSYNKAALKGGSSYNKAALKGGSSYNKAALKGGSSYNKAALKGGSSYNKAALKGGRSYNKAALRGGDDILDLSDPRVAIKHYASLYKDSPYMSSPRFNAEIDRLVSLSDRLGSRKPIPKKIKPPKPPVRPTRPSIPTVPKEIQAAERQEYPSTKKPKITPKSIDTMDDETDDDSMNMLIDSILGEDNTPATALLPKTVSPSAVVDDLAALARLQEENIAKHTKKGKGKIRSPHK